MRATERSGYKQVGDAQIAYVLHDAGPGSPIVVMAHGFHGGKIGPSRYFVTLARMLATRGISTFRFDQPGNGDSSEDFEDSSFDNWVANIRHFAREFSGAGRRVALLGQSIGGTATMAAAAELVGAISSLAVWSPGVLFEPPDDQSPDEWDEDGERVRKRYWLEASASDFMGRYARLAVPAYMFFGTADDLITEREARLVEAAAKTGDCIRVIDGLPHSAWPYERRTEILAETAEFLCESLLSPR